MSKKVISFRLTDNQLNTLDEAAHRFKKSRSEVIALAVDALAREYVLEGGELVRRTPWLLDPLSKSSTVE